MAASRSNPPPFPPPRQAASFLPFPSLQRAGPQSSPGEDLARAGHSLASPGLRI